SWDDYNEFQDRAKVGWQAGIDARFGRFLYFSPGIHYQSFTMRNVTRDELEGGFQIGDETTIQSLKMPLNAGFKIPLIGVRAQAGITPSYVLNIKTPNGSNIGTEPLNKVGLATNLGVGMDILFLTVDLTWERARVDFFKDLDGKNNMFALTAGIKF
ncbi:MAG: PorT family protein, partial [Bacteroidetes bacterium]